MYWLKATKKLIEINNSETIKATELNKRDLDYLKTYHINNLSDLLNSICVIFDDCKYIGFDAELPEADQIIKKTMIYSYGYEYDVPVLNIDESNIFKVMYHLWECLCIICTIYFFEMPKTLKSLEEIIYKSDEADRLIDSKRDISRKVTNKDLHPNFSTLTKHIDIQIDFLLDIKKCKPILKAAATPPARFTTITLKENQLLKLYTGLKENGFIDANDTDYLSFCYIFGGNYNSINFKPIKWIKPNSTTHGKNLNKKSLLNLLSLLGIHYSEITNKALLNKIFIKPDGNSISFKSSNYTNTFVSEYNNKLIEIVNSATK